MILHWPADETAKRVSLRVAALLALLCAFAVAGPADARDGLGIFGKWGAFRDPAVARCYAIAMAEPTSGKRTEFQPFATIGHWPKRSLRNQVHFRLSGRIAAGDRVALIVGGRKFPMVGGGADAWAADPGVNAAVVAALRSARTMTITARGSDGRAIRDTYVLEGAATAIDAALVGCSGIR